MRRFYIQARIPPIHYYPNEFTVIINNDKLKSLFMDKIFYSPIEGCYICPNKAECVHHIIEVVNLGNNKTKNLVPLCFECHQKVHAGKIELSIPENINIHLIRKTNKILRKFYLKNPTKSRLINDPDFIHIHLEQDYVIKYLLKHKQFLRLNKFIEECYNRGTIKNKLNNHNLPSFMQENLNKSAKRMINLA